MVADSITDSELSHGSPISRDFAKKRKAHWFSKLKQWKIDARRRQWIYQWKRANASEEANGSTLRSLRHKLTDTKPASDRFSYLEAWRSIEGSYDDDLETDHSSASSSPTSVLKNKDSDGNMSADDCFCCSKQITEEDQEEAFDDAYENWDDFSDALNFFENEDNKGPLHETAGIEQKVDSSQRNKSSPEKLFHKDKRNQKSPPGKAIHNSRRKKNKSDQQKQECDDEISECPICSEEMDATDLSFLPCPCGFRLCLFCHNKINENDGRCPACRNKYDQTTSNSGGVSFQQRGRGTVRLSPSFKGLDRA